MRYIIGINITNKETKKVSDGFAIIDSLGLYPSLYTKENILEKLKEDKQIFTIVYPDLDSVQNAISEYSKLFRRDDCWSKSQIWKKSKYIRKFYAIKVDTLKFPFKIGEPYKFEKSRLKEKPIFQIVNK